MGTAGQPPGLAMVGAVAGVLKTAARFAAERSAGKIGRAGIIDLRARGKSAALARALIVHEEETEFFGADRAA